MHSGQKERARERLSLALICSGLPRLYSHNSRWETYFFTVEGSGAKASANACAFGTPTPVTLSHPTLVCRLAGSLQVVPKKSSGPSAEQSVPNEMTRAVSCSAG